MTIGGVRHRHDRQAQENKAVIAPIIAPRSIPGILPEPNFPPPFERVSDPETLLAMLKKLKQSVDFRFPERLSNSRTMSCGSESQDKGGTAAGLTH